MIYLQINSSFMHEYTKWESLSLRIRRCARWHRDPRMGLPSIWDHRPTGHGRKIFQRRCRHTSWLWGSHLRRRHRLHRHVDQRVLLEQLRWAKRESTIDSVDARNELLIRGIKPSCYSQNDTRNRSYNSIKGPLLYEHILSFIDLAGSHNEIFSSVQFDVLPIIWLNK